VLRGGISRTFAAAVCLVLAVPAEALAGSTAREVAEGLRADPVYVAPKLSGLLSVPERGRLRLRIVRRDIGRIQIAVVPSGSAERAGGDELLDDVGDSFRLGVLIVAAAIALPFVLGALGLLVVWRRRRAAAEAREQLTTRDARDELVALGEEIRALDLDVDMPGASQGARDEYERALSLYDRANQLLVGDDPSDVELYEARRSLEEGRARLEAARAALALPATPPPPSVPPAN
jgi:hypothetical protein